MFRLFFFCLFENEEILEEEREGRGERGEKDGEGGREEGEGRGKYLDYFFLFV